MADIYERTIRFSATELETYRRYATEDWLDTMDFLEQLRGESPPSEQMLLGTKFHSMMEWIITGKEPPDAKCERDEALDTYSIDGTGFEWQVDCDVPKGGECERPLARHWAYKRIKVIVTGKLDYMRAPFIIDWKTTRKSIDLEKYAESLQWKIYLLLAPQGFEEFRYDVFKLDKVRNKEEYRIAEHMRLGGLRPYATMFDDVRSWLTRFVEFLLEAEHQGLLVLTPEGVQRVGGPRYEVVSRPFAMV